MKKFATLFCGLLATIVVSSQELSYSYDDAGNRISRTIFIGLKSADVHKQEITETIGSNEIKIYPNPVESLLLISITGFEHDFLSEYFVYNLSGSMLKREKVTSELTTLDMSSLSRGTYVFQLSINGEKRAWKIVKE